MLLNEVQRLERQAAEQHAQIEQQHGQIEQQQDVNRKLEARLAALEVLVSGRVEPTALDH